MNWWRHQKCIVPLFESILSSDVSETCVPSLGLIAQSREDSKRLPKHCVWIYNIKGVIEELCLVTQLGFDDTFSRMQLNATTDCSYIFSFLFSFLFSFVFYILCFFLFFVLSSFVTPLSFLCHSWLLGIVPSSAPRASNTVQ